MFLVCTVHMTPMCQCQHFMCSDVWCSNAWCSNVVMFCLTCLHCCGLKKTSHLALLVRSVQRPVFSRSRSPHLPGTLVNHGRFFVLLSWTVWFVWHINLRRTDFRMSHILETIKPEVHVNRYQKRGLPGNTFFHKIVRTIFQLTRYKPIYIPRT